MTKEEKELLLKDLCSRLIYGVILSVDNGKYREDKKIWPGLFNSDSLWDAKPYLRKMSSMTKEEIEEYRNLSDEVIGSYGPYHHEFIAHCVRLGIKPDNPHECVDDFLNMEAIDWLLAHHFDFRGLIEKGLALEAPKDMYKN